MGESSEYELWKDMISPESGLFKKVSSLKGLNILLSFMITKIVPRGHGILKSLLAKIINQSQRDDISVENNQ